MLLLNVTVFLLATSTDWPESTSTAVEWSPESTSTAAEWSPESTSTAAAKAAAKAAAAAEAFAAKAAAAEAAATKALAEAEAAAAEAEAAAAEAEAATVDAAKALADAEAAVAEAADAEAAAAEAEAEAEAADAEAAAAEAEAAEAEAEAEATATVAKTPIPLYELVQSTADRMLADRWDWTNQNLTPGDGRRRDPITGAYYDWESYVTHARHEMDIVASMCEVDRALAQAAYDRGLLRKPRTCSRSCHEGYAPQWVASGAAEKPDWVMETIDELISVCLIAEVAIFLMSAVSMWLWCIYTLVYDTIPTLCAILSDEISEVVYTTVITVCKCVTTRVVLLAWCAVVYLLCVIHIPSIYEAHLVSYLVVLCLYCALSYMDPV
jgi:hypothetical protein